MDSESLRSQGRGGSGRSTVRILLADPDRLVVEGLRKLLMQRPEFDVVDVIVDADRIRDAVLKSHPNLIVVASSMWESDYTDAFLDLKTHGYRGRIVLLGKLGRCGNLESAMRAGANAYLLKSTSSARFIESIMEVMSGHTVIDQNAAAEAVRAGPNPLTSRETILLKMIEDGRSTAEMAKELGLTSGTVRNIVSSMMVKLGVDNRVQALAVARHHGWI